MNALECGKVQVVVGRVRIGEFVVGKAAVVSGKADVNNMRVVAGGAFAAIAIDALRGRFTGSIAATATIEVERGHPSRSFYQMFQRKRLQQRLTEATLGCCEPKPNEA